LIVLIILSLGALLLTANCGGDDDTAASGSPSTTVASASRTRNPAGGGATAGSNEVRLKLLAENLAFDKDRLTVPAGSLVTLDLTNRDDVPHNFAAYRSEAADQPIFVGETFSGPGTATVYQFDAPAEAGNYFFRCDVHPTDMKGTLEVDGG